MIKSCIQKAKWLPSLVKRKVQQRIIDSKISSLGPSAGYSPGSANWLAACEVEMGGHAKVSRNKVSPMDPRTPLELNTGGMIGGDKMIHMGYAENYAKHLKPFIGRSDSLVIVECGILKGTGLAVLSKLFPDSLLVGLDIDLAYTKENLKNLKDRKAFEIHDPVLLEFDQFQPNTEGLQDVLGDRKIDIVIDDGFHSVETIMNTFEALRPLLAEDYVYFSEDNPEVHDTFREQYPELEVYNYNRMTVLNPRKTSLQDSS